MAPVKGQKKSSVGKWIDGKVHNFKKASKVKSPEPKVKDRRRSVLLKRLDISIHELPSSPNSPHRASMRRTRRMSMAPAATKATAVTAVTKKPPVSSKIPKSFPKNMSSSTTSSVAKMVASTSPSKPRLTLGNRSMSGQTLTSSSVSRQSRSFSRSVTTQKSGKIESTTSVVSNESWIEQISSPTVFYRVSSPGKVMGAQRRKSYTTATDIVQVEPDEIVQKRVRERSESPVNPKTRKQASSVKKLRLSSSSFPSSEKRTTRAVKSASHIAERSTGSKTSGKNVESPRKTTRARIRANSRSFVNKSPTSPLKKEKETLKFSPEISVKIRRIENSILSAEDQASQASLSASEKKFSKASGSSPLKKRSTAKATSPKQVQTKSGSPSKSLSPGARKTRSPATKSSSLRPRRSSLVTNKKSPLRTGFPASKPTTDVRSKNTRSTESSTSPKSSKISVKSPKKSGRTPRKPQRSPLKSRRSPTSSRPSPKMSIGSPKKLDGSPRKSSRSPQKSKTSSNKSPKSPRKSKVSPKKSPKSPQKSKTSSNKSPKSPRKSKGSPKKSPKSHEKPKGSPKKSGGSPHSSAASSLSPSPRLQRSGALTRSARRKVTKKVVISGASPAQTSRNISTPLPPSLKKAGQRDLIVSVTDIGTTPVQLSRYLSRGAMVPPSPVNRLVRASRANPFTPKPEAVPSKLLKQNMKRKVTTEISLKNMSVSSLLDRSLVTPVTPRGGALVSRSTPASSPALPPTPPSAKYASRSYRMVATARRNISHYREETVSSSSSTPRNSTPRRSSALYTSYLTSNRSNSDESNGHFKGASAGDTSVDTSTDSRDFTASRVEEEQQSEVQISNFDVSEAVDDTARGYQKEDQENEDSDEDESEEENEEEEGSEEQKPTSKKGYCSVM